jgi:hypothetical protein
VQSKKYTAWKKNRKFGDVMGGRKRLKLADAIFHRQHHLDVPNDGEATPIYIIDNPSRDFYFPVSVDEVKETLSKLPAEHTNHLTHIWFQKIKKTDYLEGQTFQGCFICGSGVYLIVLHPFPTDHKMRLGKTKPLKKIHKYYSHFTTDLQEDKDGWYLKWTASQIKNYYLQRLLLHEIGHSIDSFHKRYWSKATETKKENWADNFVSVWADKIRETYEPE